MTPHKVPLIPIALLALMTVIGITQIGTTSIPIEPRTHSTSPQSAAVALSAPATTSVPKSTPNPSPKKVSEVNAKQASTTPSSLPAAPLAPTTATATSTPFQAVRMVAPYPTVPLSFETINSTSRRALVNILCMPRGGGSINPVSGSGVLISANGVILTNAHVAQYVLLSESPSIDLSCTIRTGAPAVAHWRARVLFISPEWVATHAKQINADHPTGSGEHDYALLLITSSTDGSPLPATFPYIETEIRSGVTFLDDPVLTASYPAEFVGGLAAQQNLYPVTSVSTVRQLLTFGPGTIDLFSVGGVIGAQGGSSGGAVINAWGKLVGIVSTTSEGATTAERDLRAISLSYIDEQLTRERGLDLTAVLDLDLQVELQRFTKDTVPGLLRTYLDILSR